MTEEDARLSANAPGCFASPSVYSMDSKVCQACQAFTACTDASLVTLEAIRSTIDVRDVLARHVKARLKAGYISAPLAPPHLPVEPVEPVKRLTPVARVTFDVTPAHEAVLATLAAKTAELARQQIKQNLLTTARATLSAGKNPYAETGPKFLRIACDMLLEGGFSRMMLNRAMVNQFGWQDTTAGPHVAQVCAMFNAFGVTQEIDGHLTLKPDGALSNED